jgi:hypothetical protein
MEQGISASVVSLCMHHAWQTELKRGVSSLCSSLLLFACHSLKALSAAAAESLKAREQLQRQCSSQASSAAAEQQKLLAELSQLRHENVQLVQAAKLAVCAQQDQQLPSSFTANAMLSSDQPPGALLAVGLATATPVSNACKVSTLSVDDGLAPDGSHVLLTGSVLRSRRTVRAGSTGCGTCNTA